MNLVSLEDGAALLRAASRVAVIGCSGGGKSTLSQRLAKVLDARYICMDRAFFWLPGWVMRDRAEQRALIAKAIEADRWVMDGTNQSSFDIRLARTQVMIWVRMPRWLCLWGVFSRWLKHAGRTRPEMTPGCPEKIDREFLRYVWNFDRTYVPVITARIEEHAPRMPVLMLKSRREMRRLLDIVEASS